MKKIHTLHLVLLLFAASLLGGAETTPTAPDLVGKWRFDDGRGSGCLLSFNANGTFDGHLKRNDGEQFTFAGTWKRVENRIYYKYKKPAPGEDEDRIIALESDYFIIQAQSGEQRRYNKIIQEKNKRSN